MDPVEINAGAYYLRGLRHDDRIDDRPVILTALTDQATVRWLAHLEVLTLDDATTYVTRRAAEWEAGTRCSWAVAEPSTGDMLGEVGLKELDLAAGTAEVGCWTHPAHRGRGVALHGVRAALRFAFAGLGLRSVDYRHEPANTASARLAARLGFPATPVDTEGGLIRLRTTTPP
ncbi:MAG TPA: GNAT family N-acetyltransferase [Pseudonocardiaceae bacterium]